MVDIPCAQGMELLNQIFQTAIILNDGHEILARLENGDEVVEIAEDLGKKFGQPEMAANIRRVFERWPPLHVEMVASAVQWALSKLDTDDRVTIKWSGDAEYPETVTRLELRDHSLRVEFAHPPFGAQVAASGS